MQVNWGKYKKALWRCAFNSVIMRMIFNLVTYPLAVWRGIDAGYELPSFATTVCHFFGFIVALEIGIYYTHRCCDHEVTIAHANILSRHQSCNKHTICTDTFMHAHTRTGCFTIPHSTSTSTRPIMSGQPPLGLSPSTPILWSTLCLTWYHLV